MQRRLLLLGLMLAMAAPAQRGSACPFCSAVSQTFTEEMDSMDVVVIAQLFQAPPLPDASATDPDAPLPKATFQIQQVIKGSQWVDKDQQVEVLYFGDANKQRSYLMMGTSPPNIMWSTPLGLSERALKYVLTLPDLPKDASRLEFIQEYLEDADEMLARDAYDEFANTPYAGVIALKDKMHHDRLIAWIQDPDVPASRRRLYFTMLGVCGQESDTPMLEAMMRSADRKQKAGLDALIACYLILKGPKGLPLVEELFLRNEKAEYADTYAAIMAVRFHGSETDVISRGRLLESLRYMLDRPELADLVIQDLARWEDWEVMPRLVELFKNADEKSSWVRVPVVNYLRACPLPEAKKYIDELAEIDPDAVKRAKTFFPFDTTGKTTAPGKEDAESSATPSDDQSGRVVPDGLQPTSLAGEHDLREREDPRHTLAWANEAVAAEPPALAVTSWQPNTLQLCGVSLLTGAVLLIVLRLVWGLPLFRFHT